MRQPEELCDGDRESEVDLLRKLGDLGHAPQQGSHGNVEDLDQGHPASSKGGQKVATAREGPQRGCPAVAVRHKRANQNTQVDGLQADLEMAPSGVDDRELLGYGLKVGVEPQRDDNRLRGLKPEAGPRQDQGQSNGEDEHRPPKKACNSGEVIRESEQPKLDGEVDGVGGELEAELAQQGMEAQDKDRPGEGATLADPASDREALVFLAVDQQGGRGVALQVLDDLDHRVLSAEPGNALEDEGLSQGRESGLHVPKNDRWRLGTLHRQNEGRRLDVQDAVGAQAALREAPSSFVYVAGEGPARDGGWRGSR